MAVPLLQRDVVSDAEEKKMLGAVGGNCKKMQNKSRYFFDKTKFDTKRRNDFWCRVSCFRKNTDSYRMGSLNMRTTGEATCRIRRRSFQSTYGGCWAVGLFLFLLEGQT